MGDSRRTLSISTHSATETRHQDFTIERGQHAQAGFDETIAADGLRELESLVVSGVSKRSFESPGLPAVDRASGSRGGFEGVDNATLHALSYEVGDAELVQQLP